VNVCDIIAFAIIAIAIVLHAALVIGSNDNIQGWLKVDLACSAVAFTVAILAYIIRRVLYGG